LSVKGIFVGFVGFREQNFDYRRRGVLNFDSEVGSVTNALVELSLTIKLDLFNDGFARFSNEEFVLLT
jgi:hypothetical protein